MPNLPIVPTQITLRGHVSPLHAPIAAQLFTFGPRGQGFALKLSQNSAKNREGQWYAQSAHCAHTAHENEKCGFCGRFQGRKSIHIWP